jgi:BirA family biotin operon repressor/biotin-[acetyl-CoA-carboxylase] ligase
MTAKSAAALVNHPPFDLMRLLADMAFHSGSELGAALGVSRGAIWYQVRRIEQHGLKVFKVRGRGYRLAAPLDLLDAGVIAAALRAAQARGVPPLELQVMDECASTNSEAMARARSGAVPMSRAPRGAAGLAIACEHQTAGRGRFGAAWRSGIGTGLTFSLLWRLPQGAAALSGLSLAVGVAMLRALKRHGIEGVKLKWPNDLLVGRAKLGGILVELSGDYLGPSAVVIGVGLNVRLDAALKSGIDQPAADLAELGGAVPARNSLLAAALAELALALQEFSEAGFAPFREEWQVHHAHQGRQVVLQLNEQRIAEGEALGVAADGSLLLRSARGLEQFHSGQISLRGLS